MISYKILSTGSTGNAVIINDYVLIDCGVPFKTIKDHVDNIKIVLLTHIHGDHFKSSTIKRLSSDRPTVRFVCGSWLAADLVRAGVPAKNIDVVYEGYSYGYGPVSISPVELVHDVPNFGYKLHFGSESVFYATDTYNLNGISARNYDLYMVEANYVDSEIKMRIDDKKAAGEFIYEKRAMLNHLSMERCNDWLYANMGPNSEYVYLHQHK